MNAIRRSLAAEATNAPPCLGPAGAASGNPRPAVEDRSDAAWLARGSVIVFAAAFLGQGFQFASQVILARLLGPADFGLYGIGYTLLRLVGPLAALGLNSGVIYTASVADHSDTGLRRDVLLQSLGLGLLAGIIIGVAAYIGAPWLSIDVFGKRELSTVIRSFALALPLFTGLMVASASTKLSMSMIYSAFSEVFAPLLNLLLLAAALYFLQWQLMGAIAVTVVSLALSLMLALYLMFSLFWPTLRSRDEMRSYIGELLAFSLPASIAGAFANFINRVDRLMVGAFLPATEVGIYQAASQTSALFDLMPNIFNNVIAVRVADLYARGDISRLDELFKIGAKWSFYLSMPLFLVVCAAPGGVMDIFYGVHYQRGGWPLVIICVGMMSDVVIGAAAPILVFSGHQKLAGSVSACALVGAIALNYILIPRFGMVGGAISTALAEAGMLSASLLAVKSQIGIWPYDRRWLKGIGAVLCAAAGLWLLRFWMGASVGLAVIANLVVAEGVFWVVLLLIGLDPEDKNFLWARSRLTLGAEPTG